MKGINRRKVISDLVVKEDDPIAYLENDAKVQHVHETNRILKT